MRAGNIAHARQCGNKVTSSQSSRRAHAICLNSLQIFIEECVLQDRNQKLVVLDVPEGCELSCNLFCNRSARRKLTKVCVAKRFGLVHLWSNGAIAVNIADSNVASVVPRLSLTAQALQGRNGYIGATLEQLCLNDWVGSENATREQTVSSSLLFQDIIREYFRLNQIQFGCCTTKFWHICLPLSFCE
ncbi:Hypothetical protein Lpl7_0700 [Lacticaseibacillus paracasei subsp. tolerans Lpl7]|nr:Hypothetical protein Lpl7_0700 [Lacticaseibacillus paracasei subsp. tolerans Lpl7]